MILIDSNIIIDVVENDPHWGDWSVGHIADLSTQHEIAINEVVVAEVAPGIGSLEAFFLEIEKIGVSIASMDAKAAFLAGAAFLIYRQRRRDGTKSVLADFLIGGHAQSLGATILTRDPRFYRAYFPSVPLITPSKDI